MKPGPQKKWGQNFLRNPGAADHIVEALEAAPEELILEIGPGEGVLTRRLVTLPNRILAWEIDPDLVERLHAAYPTVNLVHTDATREPLPEEPYRAVGNLPYNVATPILRRVVASSHWRRAVFMFQK
jgi:23S rRNA (adenine-N6)-dimethyltransferase